MAILKPEIYSGCSSLIISSTKHIIEYLVNIDRCNDENLNDTSHVHFEKCIRRGFIDTTPVSPKEEAPGTKLWAVEGRGGSRVPSCLERSLGCI